MQPGLQQVPLQLQIKGKFYPTFLDYAHRFGRLCNFKLEK